MCLQFILIWTAPVFTFLFYFVQYYVFSNSLTSSFMLYDVTLYYDMSFVWLTLICMYNLISNWSVKQYEKQAIWKKTFCLSGTHENRKIPLKTTWVIRKVWFLASRWRCGPAGSLTNWTLEEIATDNNHCWRVIEKQSIFYSESDPTFYACDNCCLSRVEMCTGQHLWWKTRF